MYISIRDSVPFYIAYIINKMNIIQYVLSVLKKEKN